jgi:hypothetical protein
MTKRKSFLFVDLSAQADGAKPFDGMAAGEFIDMSGRKASFKKEDMAVYVKNTKAVLASTKDSAGNVVGLPIDGANHDHREAAGWVVDVNLGESGDVIQFTPRWNEWGLELISSDIMRFFSPTVDLTGKSIMGGSLTNWPATRDGQTGRILLRPIELSQEMYELTDESLFERGNRIARAFREMFRDGFDTEYAWPIDVFDSYVICEMGDKLYKVEFSETAEGFEFSEFSEWKEVKRSYVEAAMRELKKLISGLFQAGSKIEGAPVVDDKPNQPTSKGDLNMPDPVDMTAEQRAELERVIDERANLRFNEMIEREQRKNHILDFSRTVTGKGLPVTGEDLTAFLSSLTAEQLKQAEAIFTKVADTGAVDFTEHGHSKVVAGAQSLPEPIKASLKAWTDAGQTVEEFFKVNAVELGSQADYNLTEFMPKEK